MATERQSTGSSPLVDIMREVYETKIRLKRVIQSVLETDSDDFEEYVTLTHNAIVHEYNRGYVQGYNEGYHVIFPTAQLTEDDYGHGLREYDVFVPSIPEYSTDTFIDNLVAIMKDSYRIRLLIKAALNTSSDEFVTYPDILEELLAQAYEDGHDDGYDDGYDDATAVVPPISDLGTPVIHYTQGESYVTITANGASGTTLYWWSSLDQTRQLYTGQIVIRESQTIFAANFIGDNMGTIASKYCDMSNGEEVEGLAAPQIVQNVNNITIRNRDNNLSGTIWYSFDNLNWRQYTGTITITEDTTIYAYYTLDDVSSDTVSKLCLYYEYTSDYLTYRLVEPGTVTINIDYKSGGIGYYKVDDGEWISYPRVRGLTLNNVTVLQLRDFVDAARNGENYYGKIVTTGVEHIVYGKLSTLFSNKGTFSYLFKNDTTLTSAFGLSFAGLSIGDGEFSHMFYGCTALTTAPVSLPITNQPHQYLYNGMFADCTALTTAPEIPTTVFGAWCCDAMFYNCTSLTSAPIINATTLGYGCCNRMFYSCTSLTTAPSLPATTLAAGCYSGMFEGCTSLINVQDLPATTLDSICCRRMFAGCTSLRNAPELPATTLAKQCYYEMFADCTSLRNAPELPATTLYEYCYVAMFFGCTSLRNAPELPATTLHKYCYSRMFQGCTSLTTAPSLPATTLAVACYGEMFRGCTSLTTAPELPATALYGNCYNSMFSNCTNLNYIKCMASNQIADMGVYTGGWLSGVAESGTFIKKSGVTWPTGTSGIPSGWTVQEVA